MSIGGSGTLLVAAVIERGKFISSEILVGEVGDGPLRKYQLSIPTIDVVVSVMFCPETGEVGRYEALRGIRSG